MIEIQIGQIKRKENEIDELWINEQVNKRRADGVPICVRIIIKEGIMNFALASSQCQGGSPKSTPPTQQERAILDLWKQCGLDKDDFRGGNVFAFLKRVRKYL